MERREREARMEIVCPGGTIAHYRLEAVLGAGAVGIVFLAQDTRLCRQVAIKVLSPDRLDERSRARLRAEALALSGLSHPNIAMVLDLGAASGVDYLVLEFVPGRTVGRMLIDGPWPSDRVAYLGAQLARGLAAAHAADVIHRDIKPENLRVTPDGVLKILDFGVAVSPAVTSTSSTTDTDIRSIEALAGTLRYMAPERLRGGPADARTDVFSVGVVLYEMACGRPPYPTQHPVRLIEAILEGKPPRPRAVNPAIDKGLERVILRAMRNNPWQRYGQAAELAADLEEIHVRLAMPDVKPPSAVRAAVRWFTSRSGVRRSDRTLFADLQDSRTDRTCTRVH